MAFKAISLNESAGKIEHVSTGEELVLDGSQRVKENMIIEGDLTVLGAATELITTETKIADPVIDFGMEDDGSGSLVAPTAAAGPVSQYGLNFHYWDGAASAIASISFDKTTQKWTFNPGTIVSDLEGNASTATALETARDISIGGDVVASAISFDGTANVALVSVIQPQAVEFSMMDPLAYRDSVEQIRASASASDTEFATEKAIALFVEGSVSNLSTTLQAELDATQLALGMTAHASATLGNGGYYMPAVTAPAASGSYAKIGTDIVAGSDLVAMFGSVQGDMQALAERQEQDDIDLQAELDDTQAGAGLAADGSYTANGSANYISTAGSLADADDKLDAAIKVNEDAIAQEVTDRTQAITDLKFVGIGSSNQTAFAPLVLTIEDLDASLTDADLRLAANHPKRLGFAVKGTALANNYMVIDANGTSKDFEWSLSIEEVGANFPAQGAGSQGTFASTQAIVDYVQAELSTLQAAITAASQWSYDVNNVTGTLDFASGDVLKVVAPTGSLGVVATVDPLTDTIEFGLDVDIAVNEHVYFGKELVQMMGAGSVSAYSLLKADLSAPTDNSERVIGMSAGVDPDGNQLMFVNGQIIKDSGLTGFAVGDVLFLGATGSIVNAAPAYVNGNELVEIGMWTAEGLMLNVRHIMTY